MKRFISILLSLTVIGASTVFAAENTISVDGEVFDAVDIDGKMMFPVRTVSEKLGYTVEWQAETKTVVLSKGAQYITFTVGVDGYTFAKTAPQPLGTAPVISEGATYVPFELFTEIMQLDGEYGENGFEVKSQIMVDESLFPNIGVESDETPVETPVESVETPEENKQTEIPVIVMPDNTPDEDIPQIEGATGIVTDIEGNTVTVNDYVKGEVILNIGEDCKITDIDGKELAVEDIAVDSPLEIEYGNAMTMSIPPQNNPISIVVIG